MNNPNAVLMHHPLGIAVARHVRRILEVSDADNAAALSRKIPLTRAPAITRDSQRSAGKATKGFGDRAEVVLLIGRQPSEVDEGLDRAVLYRAHETELVMRARRRRYTRLHRPLNEAGQGPGNGALVGMIGFGEPAQPDEICYYARPDFNGNDGLTLPAPLAGSPHSLRTGCDDARITCHYRVLVLSRCLLDARNAPQEVTQVTRPLNLGLPEPNFLSAW
jgi:hypothetical protein